MNRRSVVNQKSAGSGTLAGKSAPARSYTLVCRSLLAGSRALASSYMLGGRRASAGSHAPGGGRALEDHFRAARRLRRLRLARVVLGCTLAASALLALATWASLRDLPKDLNSLTGTAVKSQVLARDGTPLSYTLENAWNTSDAVPLAAVPALLQTAFIVAEDQHFYEHHGVDWPARCAALWLDVREGAAVRR